MANFLNPYTDQNVFTFLFVFLKRLFLRMSGTLSWGDLVSDEIQILVLCGAAAACSLVGTFLVLRKMAMLANALSHTLLLGIVASFLFLRFFGTQEDPLQLTSISFLVLAALATGILTMFLTEVLHRKLKLQEDASIGLVFTTLFALGILLITLFTRHQHVGTELIMGNVDALRKEDLKIVGVTVLGTFVCIMLFFRGFKLTTFDPGLSRSMGFSPLFFNYLLMVLASGAAISAFRAVGVLMVLAFFIFPPLTARLLTHRLIPLMILSILIGSLCSLLGVAISRHILSGFGVGLSTGGIVTCTLVGFFGLASLFSPQQGLLVRWITHYRLKKATSRVPDPEMELEVD